MSIHIHQTAIEQDMTYAIEMRDRQSPLMKRYRSAPQDALIIDSARTSSELATPLHPFYSSVTFGDGVPTRQAIGVHRAVGGESDFPNPGELLSAAIAGCLDCTTRIIANRLGIHLTHLEINVDAKVDVRGTLQVDRDVAVGFQSIDIDVKISAGSGVSKSQLDMLIKGAEASCVVLQTLRNPPLINLSTNSSSN